jgi:hypothetical protein
VQILKRKKKENLRKMKKIGKIVFNPAFVFAFLLNLFFSVQVLSATQVSASLDRDKMGIGDAVTLTLQIQTDEELNDGPVPQLPRVQGLEEINSVDAGRQTSSSMVIRNGEVESFTKTIQTYQYLLSPQKEGKLIIPVIDVEVNGKTYKTQPLNLDVKEEFRNARKNQEPGRRFPPGFGDDEGAEEDPFSGQNPQDLFEQLLQQQQRMLGRSLPNLRGQQIPNEIESKKLDVNTNDPFFVYLDLDKTQAYEGEQVTANWYIYTKGNIDSLDRVKFPDLKGFWKEIIEEVPALRFQEEIVNGVRYKKALLASHALFPIKAGPAVIDEFKIKAKVRQLTQFGWGKPFDVTKVSKRTAITVLPLPQEGRTLSFSGAVGIYRVILKTEGTTFPANQPFSVRIRYEGIGNAKLIELPAIAWPEGLEVYDSKSEAKFFKEGNSYKEFEVLVIPRRTGEMKIPSLELTYFDPAQKKYVSDATQEIVLQITEGAVASPGNTGGIASTGQAGAAAFNPQPILQFPEAGISFVNFRWPIYFGLTALALILIFLNSFKQLRGLSRESEIYSIMSGKLEKIEDYFTRKDLRKVGSEATNLIYLIVANLAGKKKADQEMHVLINEISSKDQQKYLDRINSLFDYFQLLGFSPEEIMQNAMSRKPVDEQIKQLKSLTKEIVDNLKKEDKNNF